MSNSDITGVILAGGRSTRMGQDKGLVEVDGKPLFEQIAKRLSPMVANVLINANQNQNLYGQHFQVVNDIVQDYSGPLAGMLAGLKAIKTQWALFVPCDVPSFPQDLTQRFWQHKGKSQAVYARDEVRDHPTLCLLNKSIIPALEDFLFSGERKVMFLFNKIDAMPVIFTDSKAFANLNTPSDVAQWDNKSGGLQ